MQALNVGNGSVDGKFWPHARSHGIAHRSRRGVKRAEAVTSWLIAASHQPSTAKHTHKFFFTLTQLILDCQRPAKAPQCDLDEPVDRYSDIQGNVAHEVPSN
jgi:hypothetical protein